jgi:arabinogalactan endo-1,4-beta-galactosidase
LQDCGGTYFLKGHQTDPYTIFQKKEASIVRLRLWHNPKWTNYSTLADVKKSIKRAKDLKMRVMLDFHYSDTWTDPGKQNIPEAWRSITDVALLGDSLYNYTRNTLLNLHQSGLLPDIVQVGNEINAEILQYSEPAQYPINWTRNISLLNKGIAAVKKVAEETGKPIGTMLHIAQPDDAFWWFSEAKRNGIANYDWIGLSYYSQWSKKDMKQLGAEINKLRTTFGKRLMIVEAGFPNTLVNADGANNMLDTVSQLPGYSVSVEDQKRFMIDLTKTVIENGGEGVIYWEPAWISTTCKTLWATGSHWDNAIFFDPRNNNEALPVFDYFNEALYKKP